MEEIVRAMEAVAGVEERDAAADPVLRLKDGTHCTLDRQDRRFAVWLALLRSAERSGLPVYVACAPGGGPARAILPMAARCIERVEPRPDGDGLSVTVALSPGLHFLSPARPGHEERRALLEREAGSDRPVLLAVHPATLEIVAACRPPEGLELVVI